MPEAAGGDLVAIRFWGWMTGVAGGISIACQAQRVLAKGGGESASIVGETERDSRVQGRRRDLQQQRDSREQPAKTPEGRAGWTALQTGDHQPPRGVLLDYKPVI